MGSIPARNMFFFSCKVWVESYVTQCWTAKCLRNHLFVLRLSLLRKTSVIAVRTRLKIPM